MPSEAFSPARRGGRVEWPTLALLALTWLGWGAITILAGSLAGSLGGWIAVPLLAVVLALHSSLQHEIIHGHPTASASVNEALVWPAVGLLVPFRRFRDLHLAHHYDPLLTDPHDDPESNYLDPAVWARLGRPMRLVLAANNTLLGRMVLGPFIGIWCLWRDDLALVRAGDRGVALAWAHHLAGLVPVGLWLWLVGTMPVWQYLVAAWAALGLLKVRTFLEHQAHEQAAGRSVIIEDRGPLAILFLNNNFHAVHHAKPRLPWYLLPAEYDRRREWWLRRNGGYSYRSYGDVFGRYLLARKDPVAHPIWTPPPGMPAAHPVSGRRLHR